MSSAAPRSATSESDGGPGREPTVIFIHLLRTGGVTLRNLLYRQYAYEDAWSIRRRHFELSRIEGIGERLREPARPPRVIFGHIPFGIHTLMPSSPAVYTTVLRDPVARMQSLYYYLLQKEADEIRSGSRIISIAEYVRNGRSRRNSSEELDNAQTRRLSGLNPPFGHCSRAMLGLAKENLRRHFAVVGLTERFDESLMLMKRTFGWKKLLHVRQNATHDQRRRELSGEDVDAILERSELDVELYAYAVALFEERLRREGPDLEQEVRAFKRANAAYAAGELPIGAGPEAEFWAPLIAEHRSALDRVYKLERELDRARRRAEEWQAQAEQTRARPAALAEEPERGRAREKALARSSPGGQAAP